MTRYSTIIEVDEHTEPTLNYLLAHSTNDVTKRIYKIMIRMASFNQFVTLNDIIKQSELGKTAVRNRFTELKKLETVTTRNARQEFPDAPPRLEIYKLKPVSVLPDHIANATTGKNTSGRASTAMTKASVEATGIYTPEAYREDLVENEQHYQMVVENKVASLYAPADQVVKRKEQIVVGGDGRKFTNFAFSNYGIVNDQDSQIIDLLGKATIAYIQNLPSHRQMNLDENRRIPIWVDDLCKLRYKFDSVDNRLRLCMSLLRIRYTIYKFLQEARTDRDKEFAKQFGEMTDDFQFLENMKVLSKKVEQGYSSDLFEDDDSVEGNVNRDWAAELPFTCISITWKSDFYKRNFNIDHLFVMNKEIHRIPPTLYRLYKEIRLDYYNNHTPRLFKEKHGIIELTLFELVRFVWTNEKEATDYYNLVNKVLVDIKKTLRSYKIAESKENDDGSSTTRVDLFGIYIQFDVPDLKKHEKMCNREAIVQIFVNPKDLITEAGATFNPNKRANTPTLRNPVKGIVEASNLKEISEKPRRQLPDIVRNFHSKLYDYRVGKYTIQFTYKKEDFLISVYSDQEELDDMYLRLAEKANVPLDVVELLFDTHMRGVSLIPDISHEILNEIVYETNMDKDTVVRFFIPRVKTRMRYLAMPMAELREAIEHFDSPSSPEPEPKTYRVLPS